MCVEIVLLVLLLFMSFFFFFNDPATTEIYTLSLHDALPISLGTPLVERKPAGLVLTEAGRETISAAERDRKSTRLNSSHVKISYAVFCLKKKKKKNKILIYNQKKNKDIQY